MQIVVKYGNKFLICFYNTYLKKNVTSRALGMKHNEKEKKNFIDLETNFVL